MDQSKRLIVTMTEQCRRMIVPSKTPAADLPAGLQAGHLLWMCDKIREHADDWPATKLHRWIGFIQGAMLANRVLDVDAAKAIFDAAKTAHGAIPEDHDLVDHLDPAISFRLDLGGQG